MASFINNFIIFRNFPLNLCQNIKTFCVINTNYGYCVLNDNKVYVLGEDIHKILGYNKSNEKYVIITELCDQNIEEFYSGNNYMFARNDKNEIFSWGQNDIGQLGRGFKSESKEYLKPEISSFLSGIVITDISCGFHNCVALSSDGLVYVWGNNSRGHLGCGDTNDFISTPLQVNLKEKIKFIQCNCGGFFAITFDGNVYYWGLFDHDKVIIDQPVMLNKGVKIKSFVDISTPIHLYFLSFEGIVYKFQYFDKHISWNMYRNLNEIVELMVQNEYKMNENKLEHLFLDRNHELIFQTEEGVYKYDNKYSTVAKSSYKTFFEYFSSEYQKTIKTIHIKDNKLFVIEFERSEDIFVKNLKQIHSNDKKFIQNDNNLNFIKFRTSNDLPQILDSNVKYYYQSGVGMSFAYFVMNDNKVYCLGDNVLGKLGLGHNVSIYKREEILELSEQNIEDFYEGLYCMFARNDKNKIYSWGFNLNGEPARGYESNEFLKPQRIEFFDNKNIINICCGDNHCLALSSEGLIYGWGKYVNTYKYDNIGREKEELLIFTPIKINLKENVKFIHCSKIMSYAVTYNGNAYYWKKIELRDKNINNTFLKQIPLKNASVSKLLNKDDEFIILLNNGSLLIYNILDEKIREIKCEEIFTDLFCAFDNYDILLQTEECVYLLYFLDKRFDEKVHKTEFYHFFDYYKEKSKYYKKTIEVTKEGYLMNKKINLNEKEKKLIFKNEIIFETKYENLFQELNEIGKGGFGVVYEVMKKSNQLTYAIKMVEIRDDLDLKEIKIMCELNTDFVVQYIDSWIEAKVLFKKLNKIQKFLFIQMELCSLNLKTFLNEKCEETFKIFIYFISCELFKELIECVNYLHSLNPPIIHRDLKPENILISDGINGRFLKLCDFGLAKAHEKSDHSRMVGSMNYMAPEVFNSRKYNTKSDIYSLALVATEIFKLEDNVSEIRNDINLIKYSKIYSSPKLKIKFISLLKTLSKCLLKDYNSRPDCKQLLDSINEWTIDPNTLFIEENISDFRKTIVKNEILGKFFETKLSKNSEQITNIRDENSSLIFKDVFRNNLNIVMILFVIILSFVIYLIFY